MASILSNTLAFVLAPALQRRAFLYCGALFFCGVPLHAQAPKRFLVTSRQVLAAMQGHSWPLDGVELSIAAPVTATVAEPELEIESVSPRAGHEALVRVVCRNHAECLPFFASAVWPTNAPPLAAYAKSGREPAATAGIAVEGARSASGHSVADRHKQPMVRAGSRATLLLDEGPIHIRLEVICTQSGNPSDRIRVTTTDRKQVYVAEVLAPELLKGEL